MNGNYGRMKYLAFNRTKRNWNVAWAILFFISSELLIAPKGIEIWQTNFDLRKSELLIAPKGIEMKI